MKNKLLPWIIALSALSVSGSAAFYSVSGLGKMFAGASLQVMILAGSLEFAKLVTASLLYQYWKKLNIGLKLYLSIATLILIVITSAGIYGFLSSAYQETSFKVQNQDKNIEILDKNISIVQTEIKNFESQVKQKSDRLTQLTTIRTNLQSTQDVLIEKSKSTTAIRQQIKDVDSEIKRMDSEISVLNDSISSKNTKISSIEQDKLGIASNSDLAREVGPLKYIAELTGSSIDSVVNWYIIVLMLVFDPLAIALVIASNFAFEMNSKKDEKEEEENTKEKEIKDNMIKKLWNNIITRSRKKEKTQETQEFNNLDEIQESNNLEETPIVDEPVIDIIHPEVPSKNPNDEYERLETICDKSDDVANIEDSTKKDEIKSNTEDKYNDDIFLENQMISREMFRSNPDSVGSRNSFRNNPGGEINPLNLK